MRSPNCFVCYTHAIFGTIYFLYPFKCTCPHSDTHFSSKPSFTISKLLLTVLVILSVFMLLPVFMCFPFLANLCTTKNSHCLIILSDLIFTTTVIFLVILVPLFAKDFLKLFNAWSSIFENYKYYSFQNIISDDIFRRIKFANRVQFIVIVLMCIAAVTTCFFESSYDDLPWYRFRAISLLYSAIFQTVFCFDLMRIIVLIGILLENVKLILNNATHISKLRITRFVHFFMTLHRNLNLANLFFTLFQITGLLITMIYLIFHIYALVDHASYNIYTFSVIQSRTIFTIITCVLSYYILDINLKKVSVQFLQYF